MTERPPGPGHSAHSSLPTMADSGLWDNESGKAKANKKAASEHLARGGHMLPIPSGARPSLSSSVSNRMARAAPRPPAPRTCTIEAAAHGACRLRAWPSYSLKMKLAARLAGAPGGNREEFRGNLPHPTKGPEGPGPTGSWRISHPCTTPMPMAQMKSMSLGGGAWSLPPEWGSPTSVNAETLN